MKLELKHLAPYLPYELKCWVKDYPSEIGEPPTDSIFILDALYRVGELECVFHDLVETEKGFKDIKPILRPLSDLKESIIVYYGYPNREMFIEDINNETVIYKIMGELFSKHYDVFGLIEKGLAIDINTI